MSSLSHCRSNQRQTSMQGQQVYQRSLFYWIARICTYFCIFRCSHILLQENDNLLQVQRWLHLLIAVISQESQTFDKHALINSLTELLLIINIMTLTVTQKPFITHLRHACLSLFFLQRTLVIHVWSLSAIALSFTTSCTPISLNRIHSFQFIFAFFFHSSSPFE